MDTAPLVRAVITALILLEEAHEDELNPDLAVRWADHIAYELQRMAGADRAEFERVLAEIAATSADRPSYAEYVRDLPFMLWGPLGD